MPGIRIDVSIVKRKEVDMYYQKKFRSFLVFSSLIWGIIYSLVAQEVNTQTDQKQFSRRNLGGPRLGFTYIPGKTELVKKLKENNIGAGISQFGWHFEWQVVPKGVGPAFVIQFIPLFAGVEYGKVIPSLTLAMGMRFHNGYEFGMGPNLLFGGENGVNSALVVAIGKSFNYGGVSVPVNLAWATNPSGNRISVIFGYAIEK
jgi:hypothetical protein